MVKKPLLFSLVISLLAQFKSDLFPFLTAGETYCLGPILLIPTVYLGLRFTHAYK